MLQREWVCALLPGKCFLSALSQLPTFGAPASDLQNVVLTAELAFLGSFCTFLSTTAIISSVWGLLVQHERSCCSRAKWAVAAEQCDKELQIITFSSGKMFTPGISELCYWEPCFWKEKKSEGYFFFLQIDINEVTLPSANFCWAQLECWIFQWDEVSSHCLKS